MKVWLVYEGEYSDRYVVGVYSTRALAEAAIATLGREDGNPQGYLLDEDGDEIDACVTQILAGYARWYVFLKMDDGSPLRPPEIQGLATGNQPDVKVTTAYGSDSNHPVHVLAVNADARDEAHIIKIASDLRAQHLAHHS